MRKQIILISAIVFLVSSIGLGGYVIYMKKENTVLLEENFYYLNRSIRSENDVKGLSYILISTRIHVKTVDSILLKNSEITSYVEIPPNSFENLDRQLMTVVLEFASDSILERIIFYPLLPMYTNKYSANEDTLRIKRLE